MDALPNSPWTIALCVSYISGRRVPETTGLGTRLGVLVSARARMDGHNELYDFKDLSGLWTKEVGPKRNFSILFLRFLKWHNRFGFN